MLRRGARRKVKNTIKIILLGVLTIIIFVLIFIIFSTVLPRVNDITDKSKIIRPIGNETDISSIRGVFDKKDIIYDYIKDATDSAIKISQIKDGPLV
jgi:ABC-type glycerol-3-phosphate transport system permease component